MKDYNMLNAESRVLYNGSNEKNRKRFKGIVGKVTSRVKGSDLINATFTVLNKKTEEYEDHAICVNPRDLALVNMKPLAMAS